MDGTVTIVAQNIRIERDVPDCEGTFRGRGVLA